MMLHIHHHIYVNLSIISLSVFILLLFIVADLFQESSHCFWQSSKTGLQFKCIHILSQTWMDCGRLPGSVNTESVLNIHTIHFSSDKMLVIMIYNKCLTDFSLFSCTEVCLLSIKKKSATFHCLRCKLKQKYCKATKCSCWAFVNSLCPLSIVVRHALCIQIFAKTSLKPLTGF